ncbi:18757_t:CDS:2 [Gigaspora rosea]|nr:18757_t:CDS:2 [Gigaspora rosea]
METPTCYSYINANGAKRNVEKATPTCHSTTKQMALRLAPKDTGNIRNTMTTSSKR